MDGWVGGVGVGPAGARACMLPHNASPPLRPLHMHPPSCPCPWQLKENIAAFELDLSSETLEEIDAIHLQIRNPNVTD